MNIQDLADAGGFSTGFVEKTLTLGETEYRVKVKRLSLGDWEKIRAAGNSMTDELCVAIEFDDEPKCMTKEQAGRLTPDMSVRLRALINEVNEAKN